MTLARLSSTAPDCRPDAGYGDGDSTQIQLCHELPHRLRFRFRPAISPQSRIQIEAALEQHWVPLHWRDINQGQGLVIYSDQHTLSPKTIIEVIQGALSQPKVHQVAPPPKSLASRQKGVAPRIDQAVSSSSHRGVGAADLAWDPVFSGGLVAGLASSD